MACSVFDGGFQAGQELCDHRVLIGGVHWVHASDHEDEIHFESECLESLDEQAEFVRGSAWENRNLHTGERGRGCFDEFPHTGHDEDFARLVARESAVFIGNERADEAEVCRDDAELDLGFQDDFFRHARSRMANFGSGKFEIQQFRVLSEVGAGLLPGLTAGTVARASLPEPSANRAHDHSPNIEDSSNTTDTEQSQNQIRPKAKKRTRQIPSPINP